MNQDVVLIKPTHVTLSLPQACTPRASRAALRSAEHGATRPPADDRPYPTMACYVHSPEGGGLDCSRCCSTSTAAVESLALCPYATVQRCYL
jgi:hypothetical protein